MVRTLNIMVNDDRADYETISFSSGKEWERWLSQNHSTSPGIWMRLFKVSSPTGSVRHDEALEVALAFGWIDSQIKKYDEESYVIKFTPRRPGSHWSGINLETAKRLISEGRMTEAGMAVLGDIGARERELVEEHIGDEEIDAIFRDDPLAQAAFNGLPPSQRRMYGRRILSAKRPETRDKRKGEVARMLLERPPSP